MDSIHSQTQTTTLDKNPPNNSNSLHITPWRSDTERRIYSSKLLQALRHVLRRTPSKSTAGREIRATADRVLAATAKGRTRWSRAILSSPQYRWRFQRQQHKKVKKVTRGGLRRKPLEIRRERKKLPVLQKKARLLSRLVPGCSKISLPVLLEETADYISALQMQVRAMTALTEFLAANTSPPP